MMPTKMTSAKKAKKKSPLTLKRILKLTHHKHSGKRLKHSETSYLALLLLLLLCGVVVKPIYPLLGDTLTPSGFVSVSVTVPGPPPTDAPVINSPPDNSSFTEPITQLDGTCDVGLTVKIYINSVFSGSTACSSGGLFSLSISLVPGVNTLLAYNYDNLDQPGPASLPLHLTYNPPVVVTPPGSNASSTPQAFRLTTTATLSGLHIDVPFSWTQLFRGGTAPYHLGVNWGDGTSGTYTVSDSSTELTHTYHAAGKFRIKLEATDARGQVAVLDLLAVVNGTPAGGAADTGSGGSGTTKPAVVAGPLQLYDDVVMDVYKLSLLLLLLFWGLEAATKRLRRRKKAAFAR